MQGSGVDVGVEQVLDLGGNSIRSLRLLAESLRDCKTLKGLGLSHNSFAYSAAQVMDVR